MQLLVQSPDKLLCLIWISWYRNISEICNVTFIFQNFQIFFFLIQIKILKIHMDSEKSINSSQIRKRIGRLIIHATIFFCNLFISFWHNYKVIDIFFMLDFFRFSYIAKYWNSDRIKLLDMSISVKHPWNVIFWHIRLFKIIFFNKIL